MGPRALLEALRCSDTTSRKTLSLRSLIFLPVRSQGWRSPLRIKMKGTVWRTRLGTVEDERHLVGTPAGCVAYRSGEVLKRKRWFHETECFLFFFPSLSFFCFHSLTLWRCSSLKIPADTVRTPTEASFHPLAEGKDWDRAGTGRDPRRLQWGEPEDLLASHRLDSSMLA